MKEGVEQKLTVAFAGNPNVGKSTLFNLLTGLRQHTGNWPGKTVGLACGTFHIENTEYELVDLPGTYALSGGSEDERIAAEFISSGRSDCTVVVCDGNCLERSLILALQILEKTSPVIICVNLMDEAMKNGICVDEEKLSDMLGVSVVLTAAGKKQGIVELLQQIHRSIAHRTECKGHFADAVAEAQRIADACVTKNLSSAASWQRKVDRLLVSRMFGIPVMLALLFVIIWLTVWGANYPSALLEMIMDRGYLLLKNIFAHAPPWLTGLVVDGAYSTAARVISVMMPPMAIFFPLFTVLEDVGYLPRMAFLLDGSMRRCGGCGKQALTMCMGLGCNAVGVMGCRIIDSPRERLLAMLTNAMIPCNGRFPTLVLLASLFFSGLAAAAGVAGGIVMGMLGAMVVSGVLSKTLLRHEQSVFLMEMPPFRRPRITQILVRSLLDRTLEMGKRAIKVALPAGAVLWLMAVTGALIKCADLLDPLGRILGMNGVILVAFLFSLPANELFVPVALMLLTGAASLNGVTGIGDLLVQQMTWKMAVCTMVFTVFHWPCATTLMTVWHETRCIKKTAAAFLLPTAVGVALCMMLNLLL